MNKTDQVKVYQLRVYLRQISPMIWRRLQVRSDSTIADLHYTLQIAMDWDDFHLHQFIIRGKRYGESRVGGILFSDNPCQIRLGGFGFRQNERFLYEYDLTDRWEHEIRIEKKLSMDPQTTYPVCIGGARTAPPEDCGGPWAFMALKQKYSLWYIADRLIEIIKKNDVDDYQEELLEYQYWLHVNNFDRQAVNQRLKQYAAGDDAWQCQ
ncbi:plasmid pRiA4b ORF-3 family protein [Desulfobacter hydrogenophilus]|nr:plasmid pRiA4b ORF-3 family protein [Desulfobacter hydrogenophilus]NDY73081.1 plasmid pRiA4b ORF-3 family protein [Desulfobacter hydrogenophilus]RAM01087.1 plasmid pRiA4b ORF-3 family protein [Desulfobacter hydrogenophilus]